MEFVICHKDGSLPKSENIYTGVKKEKLSFNDTIGTVFKRKHKKKKGGSHGKRNASI